MGKDPWVLLNAFPSTVLIHVERRKDEEEVGRGSGERGWKKGANGGRRGRGGGDVGGGGEATRGLVSVFRGSAYRHPTST